MKRITRHGRLFALALAAASTSALATRLEDAQALMRAGKPDQAYSLLAAELPQHGQEVDYLYTAAVAALDSGNPAAALPLFENVVKRNPDHGGAWLDLARTRLELGDRSGARVALEAARKLSPPATAALAIDRLLAAVGEQERTLAPTFHAYLEGGAGYDDNLNSATSQTQIAVPLFGNAAMTLNAANVGTAAGYLALNGGAEVVKPLDAHRALYAAGSFSARSYGNHSDFDTLLPEVRGGLMMAEGRHFFRAGAFASQYYLGGSRNRDVLGVNGDWYYVVTPQDRAGLFAQYADYRFKDALANEDFQQSVAGASWSRRLNPQTELALTLFGAHEAAPRRTDGDKDALALRLSVSHQWSAGLELFAGIGYQEGEYRRQNALFLRSRKDAQNDINIGAQYRIDAAWSARAQWSYLDNRSNLALNTYRRNDLSLFLRRDF